MTLSAPRPGNYLLACGEQSPSNGRFLRLHRLGSNGWRYPKALLSRAWTRITLGYDRSANCFVSGSLLTADQVSQMLGVPKSWVYEQSRRGVIPTVTLGRYRRYRLEAIEAWIEQRELEGGGAVGRLAPPVGAGRGRPIAGVDET